MIDKGIDLKAIGSPYYKFPPSDGAVLTDIDMWNIMQKSRVTKTDARRLVNEIKRQREDYRRKNEVLVAVIDELRNRVAVLEVSNKF